MNSTEKAIEGYLITLRRTLKGLSIADRDEIVSEIGVHFRESLEQGMDIEHVISHLGPAKELAAEYRDDLWIKRAAQTFSPWLMLKGVFWLARTSALGFVCFVLAFVGYGTGGAMIFSALLKLVFPEHVGLWIGPDVFGFGIHETGGDQGGVGLFLITSSPAREVLGWWYIPVALTIGAFFIWGTTRVVRKLVTHMKSRRSGHAHPWAGAHGSRLKDVRC